MNPIDLDYENIRPFVSDREIQGLQPEIDRLHQDLEHGRGEGAEALGWLHLPSQMPEELLQDIEQTASGIRDRCEVFISIGIGGSYLGPRAALAFLNPAFTQSTAAMGSGPEVLFAGHNLSSDYLADLMDRIAEKEIFVNVISKSGTTTEPAIAFRLLKELLESKYGADAAQRRIIAITDRKQGALRRLADAKGYKTFVIPGDVGGRFSVLTPVGLLPMAVAGIDIRELVEGARQCESEFAKEAEVHRNPAYLYAAIRNLLYQKGKSIEILASFHPALSYTLEWWKQLAGESEGKNQRGIFPASVEYTTDLHSLGQWVQEGKRILFETFLLLQTSARQMKIPALKNDEDGLNYLAGKTLDFVNDKAYKGTAMAHREGGVPNMTLTVKDRSPGCLGRLFYFFERAIAMSGYLLQVNPFDQPGVEFYKKNMFALLNKPGYEKGK